MPDSWKS